MSREAWIQFDSMAKHGTIANLLTHTPPDPDITFNIACIETEGCNTLVFVRRDSLAQFWLVRVEFLGQDLWSGWGAQVNYWGLSQICPRLALPLWRHGDEDACTDWNVWHSPLPAAEVIRQWREATTKLKKTTA